MRPTNKPRNPGIEAAIIRLGGQRHLAAALGVTQPAISNYLYKGPPVVVAVRVERLTGVPAHMMRPDVFFPAGEDGEA